MLKGAVLRHKNLALSTQSNLYGLSMPDSGVMLSYLPLAHIYGVCGLQFSIAIIQSMIFTASFGIWLHGHRSQNRVFHRRSLEIT
jgi:long-subunit acyl-CoA synthetase (AMP-forming)